MKASVYLAAAALAAAIALPATARAADICLQFSGPSCDLSGDFGFFRLSGKLPKNVKKSFSLAGRACGTGTINAAASMNTDATYVNIHGTFSCDATNGYMNAYLSVATGTAVNSVHSGDGQYQSSGGFDNGGDCIVTIVNCATSEP